MAHFAQVNKDNIVERVIVATQEFINSGAVGDPSQWIQTSYNTWHGVHTGGGTPLRKNFAGIGYTYSKERDAFIPPKPYPSWSLNEETCDWEPPVSQPEGLVRWDENNKDWVILTN